MVFGIVEVAVFLAMGLFCFCSISLIVVVFAVSSMLFCCCFCGNVVVNTMALFLWHSFPPAWHVFAALSSFLLLLLMLHCLLLCWHCCHHVSGVIGIIIKYNVT